jgi:hypothetical protein
LIVLDDIHKFARWRNKGKGFFDTKKTDVSFIITGSARLDDYSKGGASFAIDIGEWLTKQFQKGWRSALFLGRIIPDKLLERSENHGYQVFYLSRSRF